MMKLFALLVSLATASMAAASSNVNYEFATTGAVHRKLLSATVRKNQKNNKIARRRRAKKAATPKPPSAVVVQKKVLDKEDEKLFDRYLQAGSLPPPTEPAPTPTPPPPSNCPAEIEVECTGQDGTDCLALPNPSGDGTDCLYLVNFTYFITNTGDNIERIYELVIRRNGEEVDLVGTFPTTDLMPGQIYAVTEQVEIDRCTGDFNTVAELVTGPPCDVQVSITCESEAGDECRSLPQAGTPDECAIDITYTYTVENIGTVDANIILFTRTRNGDFVDLMPLLSTTFLTVGESTAVAETEGIDRCVQQSFATNTIVAQVPNADLLCTDTGVYGPVNRT